MLPSESSAVMKIPDGPRRSHRAIWQYPTRQSILAGKLGLSAFVFLRHAEVWFQVDEG